MLKLFKLILTAIVLYSCSSTIYQNDGAIIFISKTHDFGTILLKNKTSCSYEFSNPGKTPLLISDVKTSCGCTVPEWPKKPILPGAKGLIKVNYDATFPGVFHKTISVFYNGPDSPIELEIKGKVGFPDETTDDDKK